jgi:hypothetical protein
VQSVAHENEAGAKAFRLRETAAEQSVFSKFHGLAARAFEERKLRWRFECVLYVEPNRLEKAVGPGGLQSTLVKVVGDIIGRFSITLCAGETTFEAIVCEIFDVCPPLLAGGFRMGCDKAGSGGDKQCETNLHEGQMCFSVRDLLPLP